MILSICMMVKDEEKNIRRCLESLRPLLMNIDSELIVVDTGSKDSTVEITKEYTNKVFFHKWNNNFSEIRNISISYAKGDWIFIIDADEELVSVERLIEFLNNGVENSKYNTVGIIGKNFLVEDDETETALISTLRLFRKGTIRYEGKVHNQCIYKKPVINLDVLFNHYGYVSNDKELMDKKFNRTASILKNELEKEPNNIYYLYQLATSYEMHLDYREALDVIVKAYTIINNNNLNLSNYKYVCYRYASIATYFKDWSVVKKVCNEGISVSKEYIDLYFLLAQAHAQLEEWEESIKSYNIYLHLLDNYNNLSIKTDTSIIMYTLNMKEQALNNICVCYLRLEKYQEAFDYSSKIYNSEIQQKSIPVIIKAALEINKGVELFEYYTSYIIGNDTNKIIFQTVLEDYITSSYNKKTRKVSKVFSELEDFYSDFNKMRLCVLVKNFDLTRSLVQRLLINTNWNEVPNFYGQIIYYLLMMFYPLENLFARMSEHKINEYLEYCASKFTDLCELIKSNNKFESSDSLETIKTNKILSRCLLIIDSTLSDEEYTNYFNVYLENGMKYMKKIYRSTILNDEAIYELKGNEEVFFIYILKSEENKKDNQQLYLSYLRKALDIYPKMKRGIEILLKNFKKKVIDNKGEFEQYKVQVKKTIKSLIENNKLEDAKAIISQYEEIVKDDIEIILFKSQIALKE